MNSQELLTLLCRVDEVLSARIEDYVSGVQADSAGDLGEEPDRDYPLPRRQQRVVDQAAAILNDQTFCRISAELDDKTLEECGHALMALIGVLERYAQMETREGVRSETIGGWSRSYADGNESGKAKQRDIRETLHTWLGNTGLLYRGCE